MNNLNSEGVNNKIINSIDVKDKNSKKININNSINEINESEKIKLKVFEYMKKENIIPKEKKLEEKKLKEKELKEKKLKEKEIKKNLLKEKKIKIKQLKEKKSKEKKKRKSCKIEDIEVNIKKVKEFLEEDSNVILEVVESSDIETEIIEDKLKKILKNSKNKEIKYIIHIADLHIKNQSNSKAELSIILDRLYKKIKSYNELLNESVIVICGDIFHDKTLMRSSVSRSIKDLFVTLCLYTDVIVILGNHDQNVGNDEYEDAITANMYLVGTKNSLFILKYSALYCYNNIIFSVTDLFSKTITKIDDDDILHFEKEQKHIFKKYMKVALYHGYLNGTKLQNDYASLKGIFNISDFEDFDIVCLGDIHVFQFLGSRNHIGYPGSTFQQSFGEVNIFDHGYILWSLETNKGELVRIANDYCYLTIIIEKDKIIDLYENIAIPKNVRLRVKYNDIDIKKRKSIMQQYKNKYNIISILEIPNIEIFTNKVNTSTQENNFLEQVKNKLNMSEILTKCIEDKIKSDTEYKIELIKYCKNLLSDIQVDAQDQSKNIKLTSIKFDNLFTYRKNNSITFDGMKGIIGICAPCTYGKSALIDILCIGIWGTNTRGLSNYDIINKDADHFCVEIIFTINNKQYKVIRTSTKRNKKNELMGKTTEKLYLYSYENNIETNLTADTKPNTEMLIEKICGLYSDFLQSSVMQSKNINSFITMSHKDKKEFLENIFGLNVLKKVAKKNKNNLNEIKSIIKNNNKKIKKDSINEIKLIIASNKIMIDNISKRIEELTNNYKVESEKYINLKNEIKDFEKKKMIIYDLKKLIDNNEYESQNVKLKKIINIIFETNTQINNNKIKIKKLCEKDNNDNRLDIKKEINKLQLESIEIIKNRKNISEMTDNKKELKKKEAKSETNINKNEGLINKLNIEIKNIKDKKINNNDLKLMLEYEETIKRINKIEIKIKENIFLKDIFESMLNKIRNHTYNIQCKECMANPVTEQINLCNDQIKKIYKTILSNEEKLKKLNIFIETNKEIYRDYCSLMNENNIYGNNKNDEQIQLLESKINVENDRNAVEKENLNNIKIKILGHETNLKYIEINEIIDERYNYIIIEINNLEKQLNQIEEFKESCININKNINILNSELINLNNNKIEIEQDMERSKNYMIEYIKLKEAIETNKINIILFEEKDRELKMLSEDIEKLKKEISNYMLIITNNENEKKNQEELNNENEIHEHHELIYKNIDDIFEKNGIIAEVLSKTILPLIENLANRLLSSVETYTIKIYYIDDHIHIYKVQDDKLTNICGNSGHESSIDEIVFRVVFNIISSSTKSNFFIIDEAFKQSDEQKKDNLSSLFAFLETLFDYILVITHDDYIKNNFTRIIEIIRYDNISKLNQ
jgi:DNA repair exonuclease SbcCD ATPase subunit